MKNCPNCGAPHDGESIRCPYCCTAALDLTVLDMDKREQILLTIRVGDALITQKVIPVIGNISAQCNGFGGTRVTTDITFESVCGYTVRKVEE